MNRKYTTWYLGYVTRRLIIHNATLNFITLNKTEYKFQNYETKYHSVVQKRVILLPHVTMYLLKVIIMHYGTDKIRPTVIMIVEQIPVVIK